MLHVYPTWAAHWVSLPGFLPASLIFTLDELVNSPVILWLKSVAYYYIPHVPHSALLSLVLVNRWL